LKPHVAKAWSAARKVVRLMTIDGEAKFTELETVKNKYVQKDGSNDCGFVVWSFRFSSMGTFFRNRRMFVQAQI